MKLCVFCELAFHTVHRDTDDDLPVSPVQYGCECRKPGCGCRTKREAK